MDLRSRLKRFAALRACVAVGRTLRDSFGLNVRWLTGVGLWFRFIREFREFHAIAVRAQSEPPSAGDLIPCLLDRTEVTPIEPVYFVQDTWFAGRVARRRPERHVDVGSSAKTMALVAQFIPVTMVDIRPVPIAVEGFTFVKGTILALPYPDASVPSLSSICVIEHIGLGRYGDAMDARGTEKAAAELCRVLARGGDLYVSVPVDDVNRVYFNAHRAFTRERVLGLFSELEVLDEQYLYGMDVVRNFAKERGFGTGMFHFRKP